MRIAPPSVRLHHPGVRVVKPLVVALKLSERAPAKGVLAGVQGHRVSVSLLSATGQRLDKRRRLAPGERLSITFCSEQFGDTPPIESRLTGVARNPIGYTLTCEVLDWPKLAEYWARILQSLPSSDDESP